MMAISREPLGFLPLGQVLRPHGRSGKVKLRTSPEVATFSFPAEFPVRCRRPSGAYKVVGVQASGCFLFLRLEEFCSAEQAESLRDAYLYFPSSCAPPDSDWYRLHGLIGMRLYDNHTFVGHVVRVCGHVHNPLVEVATASGRKVLIPAHRSILSHVDERTREIYAQLPQGLAPP